MNKLTVVQVLPELNGGGVERGTLEIAEALVAAGHQSIVISAGGRLVAELEQKGSQHINLAIHKKSLWSLRQVWALRRLFLELKPDIIHLRSRLPGWLCYLAWKTLPIKHRPHFITTVHGLHSVNAYSKIVVKGEAVIAVSDTVMDYIKTNYPDCFGPHCQRIYRGIDPVVFPRDFRPSATWLTTWQAQYPQLSGHKVLCLPGRITRLKGHLEFIELIHELHQKGQVVFGLIVGGDDPRRQGYLQEVKQRIAELGLSKYIIFAGHRADIKEIYAISDLVFSLSTKPESFGRTVLEPLAMGRPVVAYDHGGVGEIMAALYPAGRVPLKDQAALLETTEKLLQAPSTPSEKNPFLLATMINKTLALYQNISAEKSVQPTNLPHA
ncbi:glycosyltransferase [Simiduia curdlanivorans]|uniref:Glycosyltransferase n=1 Tax=Simiduia curdlanivorans TaxID=1492769 RepID=A0ABV8V2P9_9GAMM|nr:glycosyltransferase [Simiduia curdlanivorans]MDN3637924.1 glycosyltransferase [Simiduia curdlanivorans]